MGVISVRIPDEQEAWIRRHGQKPGTFAREAVQREIRRLEVADAHRFLQANRIAFAGDPTDWIREDRGRP